MPRFDHDQETLERELVALAMSKKHWDDIRDRLDLDLFTEGPYRAVAIAILDEAAANPKRNPSTVRVQTRLGDKSALVTDILAEVRQLPLVRDPGELIDELERRAKNREATAVLRECAQRIAKPGAQAYAELIDLQADIGRLVQQHSPVRIRSMGEVAAKLNTQIAEAMTSKIDPVISGGLLSFSSTTGGLRSKECLIVCGRPGAGKSSIVGHVCDWSAKRRGVMSLVFSLEMPAEQWVGRIACRDAKIDSETWRRPARWPVEVQEKAARALDELRNNNLVQICDKRGMNVDDICAYARAFKQRHPELAIMAVDHVQLVNAPQGWREGRTRELGRIGKQLRDLSDEIDVSLILLAQLNREVEKENRPPRASDLRDSGELEEHGDCIVGLWRPNPDGNLVQFLNLKGRDVPTGTKAYARFTGEYFEFKDADAARRAAGQ